MSAGKLAAQVAHGACRSLWAAARTGAANPNPIDTTEYVSVREYFEKGETKIVLEVRDTEHLLMAERYLNEHGIKTFLVIDEGRTEIPAHTPTVLATEILDKNAPEVQFALGEFKTYKDGPPAPPAPGPKPNPSAPRYWSRRVRPAILGAVRSLRTSS